MALDEGAKMALQKAMSAVKSGKMKPGDSMVVRGEPEEAEAIDASPQEGGDEANGLQQVADDMIMALDKKDAMAFKELLMHFVERCMSEVKAGEY